MSIYACSPGPVECSGGSDNRVTLEEAPTTGVQLTHKGVPLTSPEAEPYLGLRTRQDQEIVQACDVHLTQKLLSEPSIRAALAYVWANAAELHPIYVDVGTSEPENLPWEALWCEPNKSFMARNLNWPIARLALPSDSRRRKKPPIEPKLRVLVVLAAAGVDPRHEWAGIYQAATACGENIRVHALVADPGLCDTIRHLADTQVTADGVMENQFTSVLHEFKPHIVHLFCHCQAGSPPRLTLATSLDVYTERGTESLVLGPIELAALGGLESLWLVTLNACQSARAGPEVPSLARLLIADGVLATLAIRDTIQMDHAAVWSRGLYQTLFSRLLQLAAQPAHGKRGKLRRVSFPLDFILEAAHDARAALQNTQDHRAWTLPALYLQVSVRRGEVICRHAELAPDPILDRVRQETSVDDDRVRQETSVYDELQGELRGYQKMVRRLSIDRAPKEIIELFLSEIARVSEQLKLLAADGSDVR